MSEIPKDERASGTPMSDEKAPEVDHAQLLGQGRIRSRHWYSRWNPKIYVVLLIFILIGVWWVRRPDTSVPADYSLEWYSRLDTHRAERSSTVSVLSGRVVNFATRNILIIVIIGTAVASALIILLPYRQTMHLRALASKSLEDLTKYHSVLNDTQRTWAQIVGGLGLVGTFALALLNYQLAQDGQITGRFTTAVTLLGSSRAAENGETEPNLEARIGAIFALERIARESINDYDQVISVLSAYARENSPVSLEQIYYEYSATLALPNTCPDAATRPAEMAAARGAHSDVLAVRAVLLRRSPARIEPRIDLRLVNFRRAEMTGIDLEFDMLANTDLSWANLSLAKLHGANLDGSLLVGAFLYRTDLSSAQLKGANLYLASGPSVNMHEAALSNSILKCMDLADADLSNTNLSDAVLIGANLSRANLTGAFLNGANLEDVQLDGAMISQEQLNTTLSYKGAVNLPQGLMVDTRATPLRSPAP